MKTLISIGRLVVIGAAFVLMSSLHSAPAQADESTAVGASVAAVARPAPPPSRDGCITREGNTSWGSGWIQACGFSGGGSIARGWVRDKKADGHCVRWRIEWTGGGRQ